MRLKCNAKINLCLGVKGKREDGYHDLDGVMQSVDIFDIITVNKATDITVECSSREFSGQKNIAFTAAKVFFEATKITGGAKIFIEKGIPVAAGLGGGSADAAGVLLALNEIYKTDLSTAELSKLAVRLGADVPFFIEGGTMRARGVGEILDKLPCPSGIYFLIAKDGVKPSTAQMYNHLDNLENPYIPNTEEFIKALFCENIDEALTHIGNSFQSVTGLYGIDEILKDTNYNAICLSGSGPSVFAVYKDESDANSALKLLKSKGITAFKSVPIKHSIEIIE